MTDEQPYESPWTPPPLNHHANGSATAEYPIVPTGSIAFPPDLPADALGTRPDEPDGQAPDRFAGHAGYFGSPARPGYAADSVDAPASGGKVAFGPDLVGGPRSTGRHLEPEPAPVSMFTPRPGIGQPANDAGPSGEHSTDIHADLRMADARLHDARQHRMRARMTRARMTRARSMCARMTRARSMVAASPSNGRTCPRPTMVPKSRRVATTPAPSAGRTSWR